MERLRPDISLLVEEQWQTSTGEILTVDYSVPAGQADGHVSDAATGKPLRVAQLCRSRYLVEHLRKCSACKEPTCAACTDA